MCIGVDSTGADSIDANSTGAYSTSADSTGGKSTGANSTGAESTGANSTGADLTGAQQCSLHSDTDVALNWYCSSAETNSHKSRSSRGYKDCLFGGS